MRLKSGSLHSDSRVSEIVASSWSADRSASLKDKLATCARNISTWNYRSVGHIPKKVTDLRNMLSQYPTDNPDITDRLQRLSIQQQLRKYSDYEESLWQQRS